MDPSYLNVVDPADIVGTAVAYLTHGVVVLLHGALAGFLVITGMRALLRSDRGALPTGSSAGARRSGALRLVLALGLLAPLALGAPALVSLLAAFGALALLLLEARPARGRWLRRAAIACAGLSGLFMLWEGEDNLALGADLLTSAVSWRNEELAWQLETDPRAPKVGELAPDFELQDPEGRVRVRLSDFRGKRPVALVFGSYT